MKRLLYPLIACALVTIVPFLLTFENGQNIVRGLFGYEYFALLLLIVFVKERLTKVGLSLRELLRSSKQSLLRFALWSFALLLCILAFIWVAWVDLQNLLAIKGWNTGWYGVLPFVTSALAIAMVWQLKPFKFSAICFILFVALILHLEANNQYAAQPLAQFPSIDYLERIAPQPPQRKEMSEDFRKKYTVTDSVTITRDYIDTTCNNVVILVESWGVPLEIQRFEKQLSAFNGIKTVAGIHNRMYSRTRTAEREDLIYAIHRDSTGRDTTFLPKVFNGIGYKTTFLFGGDSLEHWRYKYIKNIGFSDAIYGKLLDDGNRLNDLQMIVKVDSILADTAQKHFITWTTADTKFPMAEFPNIYYSDVNSIDSAYNAKINSTLEKVAALARKHPETRFIIQGDHNPILSPIAFQEKFYKRWVPYVVLN
ncbi:MAG: hypothetical protein J6W54_10710 [Fibrobacter sp.]|uniref:hypothetical protein n=1 Tax=Fibrobacter sp. TaxID=35828 RepID=UPI001B179BB4|nr:hypothetical protein [Fibrobacter sp.]MBO7061545.1 hypothetical protein [Fibrobacter sp.]